MTRALFGIQRGRLTALTFVVAFSIACARTGAGGRMGEQSTTDSVTVRAPGPSTSTDSTTGIARPILTQLVPESARVERGSAVTLTIMGRDFHTGRNPENSVEVGPIVLNGVVAEEGGRVIRVVIPDRIVSAGEAPPRRLLPGDYLVSVSTSVGKSNALSFRVLP